MTTRTTQLDPLAAIPPAAEIVARLNACRAESAALRKMLKLSRQSDEARALNRDSGRTTRKGTR